MAVRKLSMVLLGLAAIPGCTREAEKEPAMQPASGIAREERSATPVVVDEEPAAVAPDEPGPAPQTAGRLPTVITLLAGPQRNAPPAHDGSARITSARCKREARCDQIGAGRKYASARDCAEALGADTRGSLDPACAAEIDALSVDRCLSKIHSLECAVTVDSLERINECRASSLCSMP
jgi:hypothetical protein